MKFRFPSLRELFALFIKPTTVSHAIAAIEQAAKNAAEIVEHKAVEAERWLTTRATHLSKAEQAASRASAAQAESDRAARVSENLTKLVA